MPYYPARRRRRRNYYRRRRRYATRVVNRYGPVSDPSGIPDHVITNLMYRTGGTFSTTAPVDAYEVQYRVNSVYDPEVAIGGHQPMGFDEWSNIYGWYQVVAFRYFIRIQCYIYVSTTTNPEIFRCFHDVHANSAGFPVVLSSATQRYLEGRVRNIRIAGTYNENYGSYSSPWFNVRDVYRESGTQYIPENQQSTVTNDPTSNTRLTLLFVRDTNTGAGFNTGDIKFDVGIEYRVKFYNNDKYFPQS